MKLIAEYQENDIQCIVEKKENGDKNYVIEGVFAQADQKNRNGRIYPKAIMERAVYKTIYRHSEGFGKWHDLFHHTNYRKWNPSRQMKQG